MIKNIGRAKIKVVVENKRIELPEEIQTEIDKHWEQAQKENPNIWNGEITCVADCSISEQEIIITCKKSNYAHYLYDERIGLSEKYGCSNLSAGCLIETSDNYYIVGELAENTSYPGCMQISGGNADNSDIKNGEIEISNTIIRECKEELNIDLLDCEQVEQYEIKYVGLPTAKMHTYLVLAKGKIKLDSVEMKKHYEKYLDYLKQNNLEIEFGQIHFIKKGETNEYLEALGNPKRDYLKELLEIDSKN